MDLHVVVLFASFQLIAGDAHGTFLFFNEAPVSLNVRWLQNGLADTGEGMSTGSVAAVAGKTLGQGSVSTYTGHAFRLTDGSSKTSSFKYQGGQQNIVGIRQAEDGTFEIEVMGPRELRAMVLRIMRCQSQACNEDHARFPNFGRPLPADLVADLMEEYSPAKNTPKTANMKTGLGQDLPPDNLVILSTLPYSLSVYWAYLAEESKPGVVLSQSDSRKVDVIPASKPDEPSSMWLSGGQGQMFFVGADKNLGRLQSLSFVYPGDFALAAISQDATLPGELAVEFIDEDSLKVLLSNVAQECGAESDNFAKWEKCFLPKAVLPSSKIQLPATFARTWFLQLWTSLPHWRLCNYQADTVPVDHMMIELEDGRNVKADVLRREPLVLAVHGLVSQDECQHISPGKDLSMAYVLGGGHSRNRRTLSGNLYVDPSNSSSTVTTVAKRFFDVARQVTGFDLQLAGQEPVNWLYYKPGYEYRPHCDGGCGAPEIRLTERVMTSLAYCAVATKGGATVFPPDGTKLTPAAGSMLLFTYNPDPSRLTEHSACPVITGEKMTATQWYREGVSLEKNWEHWNKVHNGEL